MDVHPPRHDRFWSLIFLCLPMWICFQFWMKRAMHQSNPLALSISQCGSVLELAIYICIYIHTPYIYILLKCMSICMSIWVIWMMYAADALLPFKGPWAVGTYGWSWGGKVKTLWRFARILFFHLWIEPHLSSLGFPLRHGSGAGCSIGSFDTSVYYATAQAVPEVASLSPGLCGAAAFPSVFLCRNGREGPIPRFSMDILQVTETLDGR